MRWPFSCNGISVRLLVLPRMSSAAPTLLPFERIHCPPADGWGFSNLGNNPMGPSPNALKYQIIGMLHAAAYLRGELQGDRWAS